MGNHYRQGDSTLMEAAPEVEGDPQLVSMLGVELEQF